ncbi:MAG TPA: zf-HC2 domain-containing protein [Phenylobacterium sp.]|uniref:anti-sigma factor family protein n=1 Tax=Phenylobacterium sp. TaxID=1871053 RepID=UPI002B478859|nr:zf-HC2 domain-containing protein [Phenylobacterium sp.]HKR88774.1 zf-HC2 domain-containing protein [Phenylobacterium sp.]
MSCPDRLRTQAFIDGEVPEAEAAAVERHIDACADCQAFVEDAAEASDAIRTRASRYAAPPELRRRVSAMLDAEATRPRDLGEARARRSFWRGAFSGAGITGLAASLAILAVQPPSPATLVDQVTTAHTRALIDGRTIAVASSDHHTVKPWFAGKIDLSPPVRDFAAQGFKLTGGRLDKVGRTPAAVLVYQHGRHEVALFVWSDRGASLPGEGVRHGYHAMFWRSGDLDFAAVSDTAPGELANFVQLVRAGPE